MEQTNIEKAWAWIQKKRNFTHAELAIATGFSVKQAQKIVSVLMSMGAVRVTQRRKAEHFKGGFQPKVYRMVRSASPSFSGKGGHSKPRFRKNTAKQLIWQSMRVLRTFTIADLVSTASCTESNARDYVRFLRLYGYVICVRSPDLSLPSAQRVGQRSRYRLVKDTGPYSPKRQKGNLWDQNLNQEVTHVA